MFANAIFHVTGAIIDNTYMPGLVTAVILYIPFYFLVVARIIKSRRIKIFPAMIIAVAGAVPMLIHGYMILFLRDRLF